MKISLVVFVHVDADWYCQELAQRIETVIGNSGACEGLNVITSVSPCDPGDSTWIMTGLVWPLLGAVDCPKELRAWVDTLVWSAINDWSDRKETA